MKNIAPYGLNQERFAGASECKEKEAAYTPPFAGPLGLHNEPECIFADAVEGVSNISVHVSGSNGASYLVLLSSHCASQELARSC